jgi:hypothetical protein
MSYGFLEQRTRETQIEEVIGLSTIMRTENATILGDIYGIATPMT